MQEMRVKNTAHPLKMVNLAKNNVNAASIACIAMIFNLSIYHQLFLILNKNKKIK